MRVCLFAAGLLVLIRAAVADITVHWVGETVEVRGVAAALEWKEVLDVRLDSVEVEEALVMPPMAGTYAFVRNVLTFRPQFPLQQGQRYRASFRAGDDDTPVVALHEVKRKKTEPSTTVARICPSVDVVPENLLKFYIHFSSPMSRGHIYDFIHLIDALGNEVELPFLELDEELWDPEMKRVTLFIDPGRIKRGVTPLEEIGPSLTSGSAYRLVIDAAWEDASGLPLVKSFEKAFRVGPVDRVAPDPAAWTWRVPKVGMRGALELRFPEPMDQALCRRLIHVFAANGNPVGGNASLTESEHVWAFVPEKPWTAGDYQFRILSTLEDLAGNQIGKPFEVDLFEEIDDVDKPKTRWVTLPFKIPTS